jgi:hypothetical protein
MTGRGSAIKRNVYFAKALAEDNNDVLIIFVIIIENSVANSYTSKNGFLNVYSKIEIFH